MPREEKRKRRKSRERHHDLGTPPEPVPHGGGADEMVRCAEQHVGYPYKLGTHGPNSFDCSGLVAYCYAQATGKNISPSSYEQAKMGQPVVGSLQPGDVMVYGNGDHVGIYVGGNMAVHALNEQRGVIKARIDADYGLTYRGSRRLPW